MIVLFLLKAVTTHGLSPPDFISSWRSITAYSNPEVLIHHNLGEMPMKIDVQVRVNHPVHGRITFLATGSGQTGPDLSAPFGGVIYLYNSNSVKIMAPGPSTCASPCPGGVAYFGGNGFAGPSTLSGVILTGEVKVRAWKTCTFAKPATISSAYPISNKDTENYYKISVGLSPDLILAKVFFEDGWIMDAQGTVSFTGGSNVGGVQYVYDVTNVYIRTPSNGKVFNGVGWGSGSDIEYNNGTVRVYTWSFMDLENDPGLETVLYPGSTNPKYQQLTYNPSNDSVILMVHASSRDVNNYGLSFPLLGTAMTDGSGVTGKYGSSFFAFDDSYLYIWRPSLANGCGTLVGGKWSNNLRDGVADCSPSPDIYVKFIQANVEEPPCGEKGCSGTPAGPFCDCGGTGFEGQYCTVPVECPVFVFGKDAIMAEYEDKTYSYLEWAEFSCMTGYEYSSGSQNRSCLANATWSGEPFTCTPIPCPDAEPAILGTYNGTYNKWYRENVTYVCNAGHDILSGDSVRTCQANATWSGTPLECALSCGDPDPPPVNAYQTNFGKTYGVVATFSCKTGHEYDSGDTAILCQTTGSWNGTALNCKKVQCGSPASGTNADMEVSGTAYKDRVKYECHPGYNFYHPFSGTYKTVAYRECTANGVWQAPLICNKLNCGDPGTPQNAVFDHLNSDVGNHEFTSVQSYTCYQGYGLITGSLQIECTQHGNWSNTPPSCEIKKCTHFGNVTDGNVYYQGLEYLNYAVTVCNPGYAIASGNATRMCNENGDWTGSLAVCQQIQTMRFVSPDDFNFTLPSLDELNKLQNGIKVEWKSTSSYQRTLNSQEDTRTSARIIGISGLLIVLGICTYICSLDFIKHVRVHGKVKVTQGMKQNPDVLVDNGTSDKYAQKGGQKGKRRSAGVYSVDDVEHMYA
ncbi:uncharacterized protein LOC134259761 [Saccostrea cucullata]|uniref:uncharacterized protein LOC134259761 n=1 Tax=Saccostrea cuccullata TaxID=36930 RepID=UPI002ED033E9